MKTKSEKKQELWAKLEPKFKHLENYCEIVPQGLNDDSNYYHIRFSIEENVFISCQGDVGNNYLYAFSFNSVNDSIRNLSIADDLLDNIVVSWKQNKEIVLMAFDTLSKVNAHIEQMRQYTNDYVNNLLIGNSIEQLSGDFINEIKTTTKIVSLMQKIVKS